MNVSTLPAESDTVPLATVTAAPPAVMAVPLMAVICGLAPSKLSAVAPFVPVTGLNEIGMSSFVVTVSAVMSATGVTVMATVSVSVSAPSLVAMVRVSLPL